MLAVQHAAKYKQSKRTETRITDLEIKQFCIFKAWHLSFYCETDFLAEKKYLPVFLALFEADWLL